MFKMKMFSLKDHKAEAFMRPFFFENEDIAVRAIGTMLMENTDDVCKYPEDYSLYLVGTFNMVHGTVKGIDAPEHISTLREIEKEVMKRIDKRIKDKEAENV